MKKVFEAELMSQAIGLFADWKEENPQYEIYGLDQIFNPQGKSEVIAHYDVPVAEEVEGE
jgi:hypothetical protein